MNKKPSQKVKPQGGKKDGSKSPAIKKPKEIQYIKLLVFQQHFKGHELKNFDEQEAEEEAQPNLYEQQPANAEDKPAEANPESEAQADKEEKAPESQPAAEQQEEAQPEEQHEQVEDRGEEAHEDYEHSQADQNEPVHEPYDQNDVLHLEVNLKSKVKSLKKIILEKVNLVKKAQIILLKQKTDHTTMNLNQTVSPWYPISDKDLEQPVKNLQGQTIAFKTFMEIVVQVDGRGQSYKQVLKVDPKDIMETTLKHKTHFWRTFMSRGGNKCIVSVQNKGEDDPIFVPPDQFESNFTDIGVAHGAEITIFEFKGNFEMEGAESDADEGGEEEVDEIDEDQAEAAEGEEEGAKEDQQPEEEKKDEAAQEEEQAKPEAEAEKAPAE